MKNWKIDNYQTFFDNIIKVSEEKLRTSIHQDEKNNYYAEYYEIPKKLGNRKIYCVNKKSLLYDIQRQLSKNFLINIMISDSAYGFRKGYSYIDFLIPHVSFYKDKFYLRLDIENFFGSINISFLEEVLSYYFEVNEKLSEQQKKILLKYTLDIITYENKLVQGAVTSPVVSNIVFRQLDIRIDKYCRKLGIEYSRYVDDLLFSSQSKKVQSKAFLERIQQIVGSKGFKINHSKTIRAEGELSLNGYVIDQSVRLSRKKLENLSRVLFFIERNDWENSKNDFQNLNNKMKLDLGHTNIEFSGKYSLVNYLAGNRAFIISIIKHSDNEKFLSKSKKIIGRIEKLILKINSIKFE